MQVMTEKKTLKQLRTELHVAQEDMAYSAGIRLNTYSRIERGKNVTYTTAQAILKALNLFRVNRNLEPIASVEDIEGLNIV